MDQPIVAFDQDEQGHWRAMLACGHRQHVRHEPPLMARPWVLTAAGRTTKIGLTLDCRECDHADSAKASDPSRGG